MSTLLAEPPISSAPHEYSPDDLLRMPDGDRFELVDGRLLQRNMGQVSSWVGTRVSYRLNRYLEDHPIGWVFAADCGYQCFATSPKKVRLPDVSFVRNEKFPDGKLFDGHATVVPDLVVEVLSPRDIAETFEQKLTDYRAAGVKSIWVISPKARIARVHRLNGQMLYLQEDDILAEPDLLPGFSCRLSDVLPPASAVEPLPDDDEVSE